VTVTETFFSVDVEDMQRAIAFYVNAFGAAVPFSSAGWTSLRIAGVRLGLALAAEPSAGAVGLHFAVRDLAAARSAVERAGGAVASSPYEVAPGVMVVGVTDTEGNTFTLTQSAGTAPEAQLYVFGGADGDRELDRLRQIEGALDPASRRILQQASPTKGWRCLEVGAGAGSIANWLANVVGPAGSVVALDVDPRFLSSDSPTNVEVVRQDVREWQGHGPFDLVHARYVLIHLPDYDRAIQRMVSSVRPGGWLALEEPDFLAARFAGGSAEFEGAFQRVSASIEAMFRNRSMDPALGARLPAAISKLGLTPVHVESEAHLAPGGSPMASIMRASAEQLRAKYVATGRADEADVEGYLRFALDPEAWGLYYATVRVLARR